MEDTEIIRGKVYLVKIREFDGYGAQDVFWAVGQQKKDLLTFQAFKNLVTKYNGRGFCAPKLSEDRITWGELKEKLEIARMEQSGRPVCYFDNVLSFREIAGSAYDTGILSDAKGVEFLDKLKKGSVKTSERKGGQGVTTASMSEALKAVNVEAAKATKEQMDTVGAAMEQAEIFGPAKESSSVPETVDTEAEQDNQYENSMFVYRGSGNDPNGQGVAFYEEVQFEGEQSENQAGGSKQMEMYEVDGKLEELEADVAEKTGEEWKKRAGVFQSISKTLRKQVKVHKDNSEKYMREADLKAKQMDEWKAHGADDVIEGLKTSLAPMASILGKLKELQSGMADMETRLTEKIDGVRIEVQELSEEVCSSSLSRKEDFQSVVKNLASNGLTARKDNLDIPSALVELLRLVRKAADPGTPVMDEEFFKEGERTGNAEREEARERAVVILGELGRRKNASKGEDQLPGNVAPCQVRWDKATSLSGTRTDTSQGQGHGTMEMSRDVSGKGLLPTPLVYRQTELSYVKTRKMSGCDKRVVELQTPTKYMGEQPGVPEGEGGKFPPRKQVRFSDQQAELGSVPRNLFTKEVGSLCPPKQGNENQLKEQFQASQQEIRRVNAIIEAEKNHHSQGGPVIQPHKPGHYMVKPTVQVPKQVPQNQGFGSNEYRQLGSQDTQQWQYDHQLAGNNLHPVVNGQQVGGHGHHGQDQGQQMGGYGGQGVENLQNGGHVQQMGMFDQQMGVYAQQVGVYEQQMGVNGQYAGVYGQAGAYSQQLVEQGQQGGGQGQIVGGLGQLPGGHGSQVVTQGHRFIVNGQQYVGSDNQCMVPVMVGQHSVAGVQGMVNSQVAADTIYQPTQGGVLGQGYVGLDEPPPVKRKRSRWDIK